MPVRLCQWRLGVVGITNRPSKRTLTLLSYLNFLLSFSISASIRSLIRLASRSETVRRNREWIKVDHRTWVELRGKK